MKHQSLATIPFAMSLLATNALVTTACSSHDNQANVDTQSEPSPADTSSQSTQTANTNTNTNANANANADNSDTSKIEAQSNEANSNDAEAVVRALITAMQNKEADKVRALFSADARQSYGDGEWKSGEDFFKWLNSDILRRRGKVKNAQFHTTGNQVVVTGDYSSWGYSNDANFLFTVENGKIVSWEMRY